MCNSREIVETKVLWLLLFIWTQKLCCSLGVRLSSLICWHLCSLTAYITNKICLYLGQNNSITKPLCASDLGALGTFAISVTKVPRIQEEPALLTKIYYLYPLKSLTAEFLIFVLNIHKFLSKLRKVFKTLPIPKYESLMMCWLALLFKKRRRKASLLMNCCHRNYHLIFGSKLLGK